MPIIGIDLGTTNSVIACFEEDGVKIIPNRLGAHLTPSIVGIDQEAVYVGEVARELQVTHPEQTAALFKRNMGTKKEFKLGEKSFLPEELASFVLRALKEDAEAYLGEKIIEAVISVPAYFNDLQRKATKRAAYLAGIKVERLINEPTAAAIAYGLHEEKVHTKFLVFDLGGGTFDVSILELYKNVMEVRGVAGDNYLGGEEFTEVLMELFANHYEIYIETLDHKTLALLKREAERAKMSFGEEKTVIMSCQIDEEVLEMEITSEMYEKACNTLLMRLKNPIERALKDAAIKLKAIDAIVLVGGGTKLPLVRNFVSKLFGRIPFSHIDPDEAVAMGAGVQAAMKKRATAIKEVVLTDVCPYTLGTNVSIEKPGGYFEAGHFCPIIERNTIIPVSRIERLYTVVDRQKRINVEILQGESRLCKDNIYLGEISVEVPSNVAGKEAVDIRYTYDINGLLEVEVRVISTGLTKKMVIEKDPGHMTKEEIEKRLEVLNYIKIHPREKEENRLLLAKGERLYETSTGIRRIQIDRMMQKFENVLNAQDEKAIDEVVKEMRVLLKEIEEVEVF